MKKFILNLLLFFIAPFAFACGWGWSDGMSFYNLFEQTNISTEEFYPFLRDDTRKFYNFPGHHYESEYPKGNIKLWNELLSDWDKVEIQTAVYEHEHFDWKKKKSRVEQNTKLYLEFARYVNEEFSFRKNIRSWNYEKIMNENEVHYRKLINRANELLSDVKEEQLKARYYYQIIRIFHYSQNWEEAIQIFENKVEGQFEVSEIYYYILDQVAGCYFSTKEYEKAAYLFTKVVNYSQDRKESAYVSFSFCANYDAQGKMYFKDEKDKMDLLFMKGIRSFSDQVATINKFIDYNANDKRIEVLFMRALNDVEREVWPKLSGSSDKKKLPRLEKADNINELMEITSLQINNKKVSHKNFWKLADSYLYFINKDIDAAKQKLEKVDGFEDQKSVLSIAYEVFTWKNISEENEEFLYNSIQNMPEEYIMSYNEDNDLLHLIKDRIAHVYYKNGELAKAYLTHNSLESMKNIGSLQLLNALEAFYKQDGHTAYEKLLLNKKSDHYNFLDYVNHHKGIYFMLNGDPKTGLTYFEKSNEVKPYDEIPGLIFSNNTKECFECDESYIMEDKVYKAGVFDFIPTSMTRKELAESLIQLEEMRTNKTDWKAKLANYLLANYYFNISNTGYYRGIFTGRLRLHSRFFSYTDKTGIEMIANKEGYNLSDVHYYTKDYYGLSDISKKYYQNTIDLSTDRELNARCVFMMAKCDLNDYYNNKEGDTFEIKINRYSSIELPKSRSYKLLKHKYYDTKFHKQIIKQCSYFRYYSALN